MADNDKVVQNSSNTTVIEATNRNPYFLPPPTTIKGWNTKRLLPSTLLSQYSAYAVLFLILDEPGSVLSSDLLDESNSIILGTPSDTVYRKTIEYYNNPKNYTTIASKDFVQSNTTYYSDSISNGTNKVFSLGGFNAVIKGYLGAKDGIHKIIPITTKLSQLVQPDGKNICDISSCNIQMQSVNGYCVANITLDCHDHQQLFSRKSLINKLFQNFSKYLLVVGWQGASVEDIQMQIQNAGGTSIKKSSNVLKVNLNDGTEYELTLPKPLVKANGELNIPLNKTNDAYVFDIDDTDYGNRMIIPLFGSIPEVDFQGTKVTFSFRAQNAFQGMKVNQSLAMLFGGGGAELIKKDLIEKLNTFIKPIAYFDIEKFFKNDGMYDAELQQEIAESLMNNINASKGAGTAIGNGIGNNTQITLTKNPLPEKQEVKKPDIQKIKNENEKKKEELKKQLNEQLPNENFESDKVKKQAINEIAFEPESTPPKMTLKYNGIPIKFYSLKRKQGINLSGLSPDSVLLLKRIDTKLLNMRVNDAYISSGVRKDNIKSHHYNGQAVDIVVRDKSMQSVARELKNSGVVNPARIQFEKKGQINSISKASGDHIHITLLSSFSFGEIDVEDACLSKSVTELKDDSPDILDEFGNIIPASLGKISEENLSANNITINTDTATVENNIFEKDKVLQEKSSVENNTTNNSINTNNKQSGISLKKVPAAYRLGDVITTILDVVDELLINTNNLEIIKNSLSKAKIQELQIKNKLIKVSELKEEDVFEKLSNGKINRGKKNKEFLDAVDNKMKNQNFFSDIYNNVGLQLLLDEIRNGASYMSETLGYDIVSDSQQNEQTGKFIQTIEYFKNTLCGIKYNDIKNYDVKYPMLYDEYKVKIFNWEKNYIESLNKDFPITVADLPISIDTFNRCIQGLIYKRTSEDIINEILTAVSNDYGFTLHFYHRTPGAVLNGDMTNDFSNERSSYKNTGRTSNDDKIFLVIHDEFLTDEKIIKMMSSDNDVFKNMAIGKSNIPNQSNILAQNMNGNIESLLANTKESMIMQNNFIDNEYSSKKLNNAFIIDYGSINSLVKSIKFSKVDGQYNIPNQYIYRGIYSSIQQINNSFVSADITNENQKQIVKNLSSIQNDISLYLINELKIMPGHAEYELKTLQLISEVFESINSNNETSMAKNKNIKPKIDDIKAKLKDEKTFEKDEDRRTFLNTYISTYLYNRPMGIKYNFYLGKINCTIHGTMGLGLMQGIYVRGIVPQLEGIYRITNLQHTFNIGSGTFDTSFEAGLINSHIMNQTQKVLSTSLK